MMEQNANQEQSATAPKQKFNLFDLLSVLLIVALVVMLGVFALIYVNPYTPLNPFPPSSPSLPQLIELPTATATSIFPPTWTPTVTLEPTATITPEPSATPLVEAGPTQEVVPTETGATPTATSVTSGSPYALRGEVMAFPSSAFNSDLDCNWTGVGGQVTDLQGSPVIGLTVQLGGSLNGASVYMLGLTGTAIQYGRAGYEFKLADQPVASKQSLWVQLLDQAGLALSERVYFDTYNDCQKNLILINFKQVH